jgi:hypothetical protein
VALGTPEPGAGEVNDLDPDDAPVESSELRDVCDIWGEGYVREVLGLVASAHHVRQILPKAGYAGTEWRGARLTPELVRVIRELSKTKNAGWIARQYGLDSSTVRHLLSGKTWSWVE